MVHDTKLKLNSELKNRHGYDCASSSGLFGMEIQGATTIFVVNIKRILTHGEIACRNYPLAAKNQTVSDTNDRKVEKL